MSISKMPTLPTLLLIVLPLLAGTGHCQWTEESSSGKSEEGSEFELPYYIGLFPHRDYPWKPDPKQQYLKNLTEKELQEWLMVEQWLRDPYDDLKKFRNDSARLGYETEHAHVGGFHRNQNRTLDEILKTKGRHYDIEELINLDWTPEFEAYKNYTAIRVAEKKKARREAGLPEHDPDDIEMMSEEEYDRRLQEHLFGAPLEQPKINRTREPVPFGMYMHPEDWEEHRKKLKKERESRPDYDPLLWDEKYEKYSLDTLPEYNQTEPEDKYDFMKMFRAWDCSFSLPKNKKKRKGKKLFNKALFKK